MRTYGTLAFDPKGKRWAVACEAHVAIVLKRLFVRAQPGQRGAILLTDTATNARELQWFIQRYPLAMDDATRVHLVVRAGEHRQQAAAVDQILSGKYQAALPFELALPPRPYQRQAAALALSTGRLLLADDLGLGKAQPLDARVLTPTGWRAMGDLRVGDMVIDPDGGVGWVEGVYPQGEREVFRVATADGSQTECCDEHLWLVMTPNDRRRGGGRVLPLSEIRERLTEERGGGNRCSHWFLPLSSPTAFEPITRLPVDPYLLGVLLGDGCLQPKSVKLSSADEEILERVRRSLPAGMYLARDNTQGRYDWRLASADRSGPGRNPLLDELRHLGLAAKRSWEKSIPPIYLVANVGQRLELLRGLMDTDGTCGKDGVCTFTTTSEGLANDVRELVGSLGGFASKYSRVTSYAHCGERRNGRRSYTLNIRMPMLPFHLSRKAERWRVPLLARAIKSVERVGRKPVQCIRVSTKRRLYVTDGYIVTHNTASAITTFCDPRTLPALVVTLTHLPKQWAREIGRFAPNLRVHVVKRGQPYDLQKGGALPDVIVMNYAKLAGWADALAPIVKSVVFDEAQELRRPDSNKYVAAKQLADAAAYRLGLTATPIYNLGSEFHAVLDVIAPDSLGSKEEFLREWCKNVRHDNSGQAKAEIAEPKVFGMFLRDQGLMLRRTRADVGRELPPLQKIEHCIDANLDELNRLDKSTAELARILLRQGGAGFDKMQAARDLDAMLRRATGLAKAPFVAEFVKMLLESEQKVVLYGWHHAVYDVWRDALKDFSPVFFTGEESPAEKERSRLAFVEGDARILVMSLRAGAGLDGLQHVCRTVVFGELDWSSGAMEQAIGRVFRDGQPDPVAAYILYCDDGADPIMLDVLFRKKQQLEGVRDPHAELVEALAVDPERVKKLAAAYLKRHGVAAA